MPLLQHSLVVPILLVAQLLPRLCSASVAVFDLYPAAARPCLAQASTASKCDNSTVPLYNACVCSNGGGFLDNSAKCLSTSDHDDVTVVYTTLSTNCANSNTPVPYSLEKWLAVAATAPSSSSSSHSSSTGTSTASKSSSTSSSTASSSPNTSSAPNKLSIGAIIGIAVGALGLLVVTAVLLFLWLRERKKQRYTAIHGGGAGALASSHPRPGSSVAHLTDPVKYDPAPHKHLSYVSPLQQQQQQMYPHQDAYAQPQGYAYQAPFPPQQMPTAYVGATRDPGPAPGTMELQGEPVNRPLELPGNN